MININGISVAIATYNGELYIKAQIESILNQTRFPNEIIIVDDFSTDQTIEIIIELQKMYPIIKYFINNKNIGPVESFKIAISKCIFPYIALSDQDDIWEKNKLSMSFNCLKKVENTEKPCIVFSDLQLIDEKNKTIGSSFWELQKFKPQCVNFRDILIGNIATGCTILMNKKMKCEIDKMPSDVTMHDHWISIIAYGIGNVGIIDEKLVKYRVHEGSVTQKFKLSYYKRLIMFLQTIFDTNNIYLTKNIQQAKYFYSIYKNTLEQKETRILKKFISLENKNSFVRKTNIGYYKYVLKKIYKYI